ncbi:type II toxin-antitoxin system HicB family antitoxin [uncultured Caulobacter sp.]|uniref:type II toxin-antitoxin system HicB family antitoxin n=1 Tax=uncultured Caulobacter sp. TaxID=158749 RepID=UPI0026066EB5|nr:type II toxin-antitoxin system HicB family antitoxin [uncultured Caulobacter sp.]
MRYIALIDGAPGAYGAVIPDCPGCTAMGDTVDEALDNAGAALRDWMEHYDARNGARPEARSIEAIRTAHAQELSAGAVLASVALDPRTPSTPGRDNG